MRRLGVALLGLLLAASCAFAQNGNAPVTPYTQQSVLFTNTGANSWVVPAGVTVVYVDGCSAGQGGAGGQSSTTGSGGGGGAGGFCTAGFPLNVTPGATLTITVGAAGVGGSAGASGGTTNIVTTITGANNTYPSQPPSSFVLAPTTGAAGVGGNGGRGLAVYGGSGSAIYDISSGSGGSVSPSNGGGGLAGTPSVLLGRASGPFWDI